MEVIRQALSVLSYVIIAAAIGAFCFVLAVDAINEITQIKKGKRK